MSNGAITDPGIEIRIEGVFPLLFRFENNQIVECFIGAIKDVPEHSFSITITKNGSPVTTLGTPSDDLHLQVKNTSQTNISLKDGAIDRLSGQGEPQSFKWVLDFEGDEGYTRRIDIDRGKVKPILRIDRGELSTVAISENHLLKRLPDQAQWTLIGKVATLVRARITLDQPDSEAELINGDFPVQGTQVRSGDQLQITINNRREPPHPEHPHPDDANNYHLAIGPGLQPAEKLILKSTPLVPVSGLPATPEASCLVGRMGLTSGG
jgi:hypothetical protein